MPARPNAPQGGGVPQVPIEGPGTVLGFYSLVESIGEGGFGTVFRAQQTEPVQREVALKIIKLGMDTRQIVARFAAEQQALAVMDHPGIAKVYDAGATETGRPYFVMELVPGEPITEFCDRERLSTSERLDLFRRVCQAVQHAHMKGVLHRDLKPSNILVARVDGQPRPKVIDFGIAKALEKPLTDSSLATEAFQVMGTPEYMPPEQARGLDVDTRADVYSLGVVLYELLTGAPPFARATGGLDALSELLHNIHEVTPQKPSTRASEMGPALEDVARKHRAPTSSFTRALRGDLDWIVMKALEKDRERRYASPAELADDVLRHLQDEPVEASPPSRSYRVSKFVRRNRVLVGATAVVALTLVGSSLGLGLLYTRSVASEARAMEKAETSRRALGFMVGMFEVSDPSEARGATVTAREVLDRGAERIERELDGQPAIRSTLMAAMGETYRGLGLYDRAEELIQSAAATREALLGEQHPEVLQLSSGLADVWMRQARLEEAEALIRTTLERQRDVLGSEDVGTLNSIVLLSQVLERRNLFEEADTLAREALDAARRTLGEENALALTALEQLGVVHAAAGRYEDAEREFLDVLAARRRTLGDDHPETLVAIGGVAELYMRMGRFAAAETLFGEAQETLRRVFGDEHRAFLLYKANFAVLYFEQQRWEEAEALMREILEVQRRTLGDQHLDTLVSLSTLGAALRAQGRPEEGEACYLEAYAGLSRQLGERNEQTLTASGNLAIAYLEAERLDEALTWATRTHENSAALHGEDHPETILRLENLANVLYKRDDVSGAAEILDRVLTGRRRALGDEHPAVTRTLVNLAIVRDSAGDLEGATAAREELLARTIAGLGFDYASVADELETLVNDLYRAEEFEHAVDCLVECLRIRRKSLGDEDPETLSTMRAQLRISVAGGRWPEAAAHGDEFYGAHLSALGAADDATVKCAELLARGHDAVGDAAQAAIWHAKLPATEQE